MLEEVLRYHNISTRFKPVGMMLSGSKDIINLEGQGVYEIPYTDCNTTYIGQTSGTISVWYEKHINAMKKPKHVILCPTCTDYKMQNRLQQHNISQNWQLQKTNNERSHRNWKKNIFHEQKGWCVNNFQIMWFDPTDLIKQIDLPLQRILHK